MRTETDTMNFAQLENAIFDGHVARMRNEPLLSNPFTPSGTLSRRYTTGRLNALHAAWHAGWLDEDLTLRTRGV